MGKNTSYEQRFDPQRATQEQDIYFKKRPSQLSKTDILCIKATTKTIPFHKSEHLVHQHLRDDGFDFHLQDDNWGEDQWRAHVWARAESKTTTSSRSISSGSSSSSSSSLHMFELVRSPGELYQSTGRRATCHKFYYL